VQGFREVVHPDGFVPASSCGNLVILAGTAHGGHRSCSFFDHGLSHLEAALAGGPG